MSTAEATMREEEQHELCDICGRNILLGESTRTYTNPDGGVAEVCDLCRHSVQASGWVRSDIAAERVSTSAPPRRRDRLSTRLLRRKRRPKPDRRAEPRVQAIRSEAEREAAGSLGDVPEDLGAVIGVAPAGSGGVSEPEPPAPYDIEIEGDEEEREEVPTSFDFPQPARLSESEPEAELKAEPEAQAPEVAEIEEPEPMQALVEPEPEPEPEPPQPRGLRAKLGRGGGREPRHVRAIPARASAKVVAALALFNESGYTRTVAGISRSLGSPGVCAEAADGASPEVRLTVAWEISWYQWMVDLGDEAEPVRKLGTGNELGELDDSSRAWNAQADEQGLLSLIGE